MLTQEEKQTYMLKHVRDTFLVYEYACTRVCISKAALKVMIERANKGREVFVSDKNIEVCLSRSVRRSCFTVNSRDSLVFVR
jgi:hypothetical protein